MLNHLILFMDVTLHNVISTLLDWRSCTIFTLPYLEKVTYTIMYHPWGILMLLHTVPMLII